MPSLTVEIERFPVAGSFTISRGSKTEAVVVVAHLRQGAHRGRGECVPYARYGETVEGVADALRALAPDLEAGLDRAGLQTRLPAGAARNAMAKIGAVLPADLRDKADASALLVGPGAGIAATSGVDLGLVRKAIRSERKLALSYQDGKAAATQRLVWPFALGFFDHVRVVVAWCELRNDFRHFRADRIAQAELVDIRYPRRRQALLKQWREREGIPPPS